MGYNRPAQDPVAQRIERCPPEAEAVSSNLSGVASGLTITTVPAHLLVRLDLP